MPRRLPRQVPVIADMASQCRKEMVQSNCMVALVNISCINGQEVRRDTAHCRGRESHCVLNSDSLGQSDWEYCAWA